MTDKEALKRQQEVEVLIQRMYDPEDDYTGVDRHGVDEEAKR